MSTPEKMTKRQLVKAMAAAGIVGEVSGKGTDWEVELADEEIMNAFQEKVTKAGGYKTGYGAWVLRANYRTDEFDFNHPASRHHY